MVQTEMYQETVLFWFLSDRSTTTTLALYLGLSGVQQVTDSSVYLVPYEFSPDHTAGTAC
jgi:hypothetical protein